MTSKPGASVLEGLAQGMPRMTVAQQRVAAYIMEHPDEVRDASVKELCRAVGTSEPVVFAVCRAAGRPGYRSLKFDLAGELAVQRDRQRTGQLSGAGAEPDVAYDGREPPEAVAQRIAAAYVDSIQAVAEGLSARELGRAARMVAEARRAVIFGVGISGQVAGLGQYALLRAGSCVTWTLDPSAQLVHLAALGKDDVAIAVSYVGDQRDMVENLAFARRRGARTIAVTSQPDSPMAAGADLVLALPARPALASYLSLGARIAAAELLVLDVLAAAVALTRREGFDERAAAVRDVVEGRKVRVPRERKGEKG